MSYLFRSENFVDTVYTNIIKEVSGHIEIEAYCNHVPGNS